jgi:multidrug efflux system membrane fusion protein
MRPNMPAVTTTTVGLLGSAPGLGPMPALSALLPLRGWAGTRLLTPGNFVRVRLPIGDPHPALLIIDRAIQSDQGLKYVYVVGPDNKVESRRITTGALQEDGLRVIEGVKPDEWVVVGALQQVRPGNTVRREVIAMPSLTSGAQPRAATSPAKRDTGSKASKAKQ